jgi:hypothetical protein
MEGSMTKKNLLLLLFITITINLFACDSSRSSDIAYIDDFRFGVTTDVSVVDNERWDELELVSQIQTGYEYWLVYQFSVRSDNESDDKRHISASLVLSDLSISGGKYSTTSQGVDPDETSISKDAGSNLERFWNIPLHNDTGKTISAKLIIKIEPILSGKSTISFSLAQSELMNNEKIDIRNGNSSSFGQAPDIRTFDVNLTRIDQPVVDYTRSNSYVDWAHVQFAQSYVVFINGEEVDEISAISKSVGSTIQFDISSYDKPFHIVIIAKSPNASFLDSYESDILRVD